MQSAEPVPVEPVTPPASAEISVSKSTSCALCHASFPTVHDQKQHVRSDLHRYNLKLSVKGLRTVDEATFNKLIGDLDESISGSDTSDSDSEADKERHSTDTTLTALLRKQAKIAAEWNGEGDTVKKTPGKAPLFWMSSSKLGDDVALGVYRAILSDVEQNEASVHLVETVQRKQLKPIAVKHSGAAKSTPVGASQSPHVFLCMIGGGHFAAMIVSLAPEIRKGPGGIEERHAVVLAHKTFHRYTTRRKQGGSQSANDNAKGNAHSAGSSIRRYNEAALEADVRAILAEWKTMIDASQLLFIRATGSTSRRTLFGPYDGQVLRSNDKRLRGFPFSTRRATQAELLRSFQELTRLKVSRITETALSNASPAPQSAPKPSAPKHPKPTTPELTPEESQNLHHTTQLTTLIRRSKAPATMLYLAKHALPSTFPFHPASEHHHAPNPLHLASSTGSAALTTALLVQGAADPTQQNTRGQTAYDIAANNEVRDAFRVARATLGESRFDWDAARVPSALSAAAVAERREREKLDAERAEGERRTLELDRLRREEEERRTAAAAAAGGMEKRAGAGRSLVVDVEKTGAERREEETRGLSRDAQVKLERERRARAAEERMRRPVGGG